MNQEKTTITIAIDAYGNKDIDDLLAGFPYEELSTDYLAGNSVLKTISIYKDAMLTTMTRIVTDLEKIGGTRMLAVDSPGSSIIIGYFFDPEDEYNFTNWVRQHFSADKPVFNLAGL